MPKKPSVIQINGKSYNAVTGQMIGPGKKTGHPLSITSRGAVIDGFMRKAPSTSLKTVKPKLASAKKHLSYPAHTVHRGAQRSKTLMRAVVEHPKLPKAATHKPKPTKTRSYGVSQARLSKAMNVTKNASVKHFMKPSGSNPALQGEVMSTKASPTAAAVAIQPMSNVITSVSPQRIERMLDEALFRADAHKKALAGRLSTQRGIWRRISQLPTWIVVSLSVLLITSAGAVFAWRSIPEFSTKVASIRSHISANIPTYKPEGFSMAGPAITSGNTVTLHYKAASDSSKHYTVKEESSNMNTSTLMASSKGSKQQVQTAQANGVQIIMQGAQAQCASAGKLTTIAAGEAKLSPDQVLSIAKSVCN